MVDPKRRNLSQRSEMVNDFHNFGLSIDTREIFLCSDQEYTYEDEMLDHRSANTFIRNLSILNSMGSDPILVHMLTSGGDWHFGLAIYDAIKNSCNDPTLSNITVLAYGQASSMGSIIPQAANYRVMMPNTEFLMHWGSTGFEGNHRSVMSTAEWQKTYDDRMLDIYIDRCRNGIFWKQAGIVDKQEVKKYIKEQLDKKQEWYLSARDAVNMGFMDAVLGDDEYETLEQIR